MTTAEHRALDGGTVTLTSEADLSQPATSVLVATIDGSLREFSSGSNGLGARLAADAGIPELTESYALGDGTLQVGSGKYEDPVSEAAATVWFGYWSGLSHDLVHIRFGGSSPDLISAFQRFDISDGGRGIVLSPLDKTVVIDTSERYAPAVIKRIPTLGLLRVVELTSETARALPSWGGTATKYGDLYVDDSGEEPILLLSEETTLTWIVPDSTDEAKVIASASDLAVAWAR